MTINDSSNSPISDSEAVKLASDLVSPIVNAVNEPFVGYQSKFNFVETDISRRLEDINWFKNCGEEIQLELSIPISRVDSWDAAVEYASSVEWENVELEAQNQLTLWLYKNDRINAAIY